MVRGRNKPGQIRAIYGKNQSAKSNRGISSKQVRGSVSAKSGMTVLKKHFIKKKKQTLIDRIKPNEVEAHISLIPGVVDVKAKWNLKK